MEWDPSSTPARIAVVESVELDAGSVASLLGDAWCVERVDDVFALDSDPPDLLVLSGGRATLRSGLRQLATHRTLRDVPVLVVTEASPDAISEAFDAGASEVVGRSVHPDVFRARVVSSVRAGTARREMAALRRELDATTADLSRANAKLAQVAETARYEATHDRVTGLLNRESFAEALARAVEQARRYHHQLAVLVVDLDRFKQVNDTLGHEFGNELLRSVAARLTPIVRRSDVVARLASDEFAIALGHVQERTHAGVAAGKITRALSEPHVLRGESLCVMPSIGIALYPSDGNDPASLLRNADLAMSEAKRSNRVSYQFYEAGMNGQSSELLLIENGLREAGARGELELYYQPQLDSVTGELVGAEALIRWNHPERGLMGPDLFLPVAERSGLIVQVGDWVLREAIRQRSAWNAAGVPTFPVSVNVSAHQLESADFAAGVCKALDAAGLDGGELHFELTESCLADDVELVAWQLDQLRRRGVAIHIDDFGTGYSSLSKLGRFSIDTLKIDRSFVHRIDRDQKHTSIARAVVALAEGLGFDTIAEGVETHEELVVLQGVGCRRVQGFLYAPPLSAPAFLEWCRKAAHGDS